MKDTGVEDLHTLQEELKRLGISVVSGRQDTVISVKIKGLAGRALLRGLRLADQLLQEKIKNALQTCTDPATKLFTDPTFGPSSSDPDGAAAICRAGGVISAKGGSQHQAKVLGLLQRGKIRWERPIYATENEESDSSPQDEEDDDIYSMTSTDHVFASNATLFADGVSSGDVIQGNLGDCWFLSALSVVATRSDLLEQTFWRRDQHKAKGLFVCKFMKNFVWNYVLIDDRLPVFGFTDKKAGKPYFARCRNPNELWVSLLEKAYAKLHGSYEALIGGFVDCALNDLTGMCSEQVILKEGFPGFGENPYIPAKPQQKHGDPFWEKLARYKQSGTLMGCSIQPPVTAKEVAVESSAGNGLYFKHAYALVDVAEIKTAKGESVRLVKLRNPWGMGEWTGPWSDSSEERAQNEDAIERFFKILKRKVGANAEKRVFMTINAQGKVGADEISQEEVTKINTNDGTFFMSYDAWMQSFTHFFAGIDFPDAWHGRRSEGSWNEANCGGNTTKSTWINNPHFELVIDQRARIFASLSQEDPRGSENLKIVPVGFHICSLSPIGNDPNKVEIREPSKKLDAYYRLYKPADRDSFQTGKRPEHLPPAIIPGTVIPSIDDDGVPQPAYTFKQAVSVEATMEPGRYCIIPSMYMRTDKATGNTNVGNFWLSVYSDKPSFRLEGGEKIVEEEEGDEENLSTGEGSRGNPSIVPAPLDRRVSTASSSKKSEKITATGNAFAAERRRKYENEKEELLRQAKRYGIGLRDLRAEFAKTPKIQKADCRHKLQKLGFSVASWDDEKIGLLFGEEDGLATGVVHTDKILKLFTPDIQEEKMACELPDMEEDGDNPDNIHREGVLEIEVHGSLNPLEFEKMLERLRIEPALTQGQKTFLVDQFDANGDGEISMTEFKHWILQDRVWEEPPPVLSTARENKALIASEVFDTVIAPLCNEIIDRAFDAYMFSLTVGSWSRSTNSTTEAQTPQSPLAAETGDIVFQRVVSLNIAVGAPTNAVEKVFEQVDGDGSGNIDQFEFIELLSALGMHLNFDDATLLMNRLGAISMGGRITIERSAFLSYAEQMTTKSTDGRHCTSLRDIVIRVDALAGTEANAREIVQCELQQLHEKISHKELLTICKALDEKAAIAIAVDDLRSLAMNLSFDYAASSPTQQVGESADQLDNIKSSGDIVARMLLQEPSGLMKHLLEFDVASFCGKLSAHLQTRSGTISTKSIWRSVFAVDTADVIHVSDFIAGVLRTGFLIVAEKGAATSGTAHNDRLLTQLLLSLAVDAVRMDCQMPQTSSISIDPVIDFNLFRLIMRLQKIQEIELRFDHALANFLQLCHGEQQHLVTVALDSKRSLIIRARDPVFKFCADFILREDEYDYQNLIAQFGFNDFARRVEETHEISRELTFAKAPHGLITGEFYPELNKSILAILERIRVDYRRRNTATTSHSSRLHTLNLSLVESDSFVTTLRNLLSQVELPFFWSVSPRSLVLSIDSGYLDQQGKNSFQQLVADTLSVHGSQLPPPLRALATFVSHTASSLLVRYEVVGRHTNVETSWQEFQDFIAGQQNVYAVMELHPQGSLFTTCVARASGSGAVKWNFKTQIKLEEPKLCDHRIDRPVVFTDTVKISRIPDSTPTTESINFIVTDGGESPGHFVVVSVRRALPSGPESPRLYCTAYDPLTSCDYAVEGYPQDWSVDFFDVTVSPSFEEKWRAMLQTMRLGETITPKLSVTVFNKKPKTDKLVGECEVSVGSAIILEGHIFEERIALHPPSSSTTSSTTTATTTAGVTALTFRFDVKKTPKDVDGSTAKEIRSCSHQVTGSPVPIKLGAQYLAGEIVTPRFQSVEDNSDDRLKQLQASIVSIEQSKLEAQEQVRQLKTQIQQLSYASNKSSDDTSERWKRRLEQARQEQFAAEEQHAARLAALQDEIRHLAEENEKQKNAPREASNLKDCRLSAASAHDILSAMRGILTSRCHARPYNGLKKALAAEAEIPGKVTFAVFNDVLGDFGLALSLDHRSTLSSILDPEMIGRINIEDFFIKLCGDAEAYEQVRTSRPQSPAPERSPSPAENPEPIVFTPYPPPVQRPVSPVASPIRASGTKSKMSWQDMKKFLVLNLPEGWETRFTEKGRPYFCNHDNRSTQWKHPRPEIETIFSEWVQENGAYFNRKSTSARVSKQKH
ncbi:hypothetical protein PF011_g1266 [Phytophthora fragariae]|uniref:Uncharacterized protein n=1 Tax=Phytophthora fragariae TaxID=53985 RepID=A0A6A3MGM5_9STRA|nr:hypothetical protein PF011_g1266 [Phytophthora fragariae]